MWTKWTDETETRAFGGVYAVQEMPRLTHEWVYCLGMKMVYCWNVDQNSSDLDQQFQDVTMCEGKATLCDSRQGAVDP